MRQRETDCYINFGVHEDDEYSYYEPLPPGEYYAVAYYYNAWCHFSSRRVQL